jgi:mannose-6-phosphate isomerase
MPILKLDNPIQPYAWGSRTVIAELLGRPTPSKQPEAELWMGAHPVAPSRVAGTTDGRSRSLIDVIQADPSDAIGDEAARRFGVRLPFLLKVLAAETPLSLQAHPSKAQAEAGYAAEERAGVPRDAPNRNYKDDNHKPELICALTPFDALCGFRPARVTLELMRSLAVRELEPFIELLRIDPGPGGLRAAFSKLMSAPRADVVAVVEATTRAASVHANMGGPFSAECGWAGKLAALYPGDPGIVSALMLNLVRLEPGQALYLPAGNLHAYLHGAGIEIMANSDNVLRGGLTPKHVDVPELLRVLDFGDPAVEPLTAEESDAGEAIYRTPAREFQLSRIELDDAFRARDRRGPEILLCTRGSASVSGARLDRGAAAFVTASEGAYELSGNATLFRATLGVTSG